MLRRWTSHAIAPLEAFIFFSRRFDGVTSSHALPGSGNDSSSLKADSFHSSASLPEKTVSESITAHLPSISASQASIKATSPKTNQPAKGRVEFSALMRLEEDRILLKKAEYLLFSLAYDSSEDLYGLYCATTNEATILKKDLLWKAALWIDERISGQFMAGLVFPSDSSPILVEGTKVIKEKCRKRIVIGPDSWGVTYLAFQAQNRIVKGSEIPTGLEHAHFLLTLSMFNSALFDPSLYDLESGGYSNSESINSSPALREALLNWSTLIHLHKKFGTPGSRRVLNPVEQIVRRAIKSVNVFVVDINIRVGKGSISDGHTMIVTIYDAQKRQQSVHNIRSLAEETTKLNALTSLLYGEGSTSISLFVPSWRTRTNQLMAFARTCRPKSPFFVAEASHLVPYFTGISNTDLTNVIKDKDPRLTWEALRLLCFPSKSLRKDEGKNERQLHGIFTALANKLFEDRIKKVSPAITSAMSSIPPQEEKESSMAKVRTLEEEIQKTPMNQLSTSALLNRVNISDAEVVFALQEWRSRIYENKQREAREEATIKGIQRFLILDLETTTLRRYKRVASPFTKENYVVLSGARDYQGNVFMPSRYFDRSTALSYDDPLITSENFLVEKSSSDSLFLPQLDEYDIIVGHNIKFDLLHIWRDAELRRFFRRGGKIWDTMYAEYLLTGHQVKLGKGAALEDIAKSYGGQTPKLDAVKKAWKMGTETYDIPYATLVEYLHGDLENTELIYRKQIERAFKQRQGVVLCARMDGLLCTTEMEYNGLKTNVELAMAQSSELVTKVFELRRQLEASIPTEIPPDCRKFFNWSSNQHLIILFFGGVLKLNTNARESKILPGECFERHTLFVPPAAYSAEEYPEGVFLRPPVHILGPGDCAIMGGTALDKGTKVFKAYFDSYMSQANFRKSTSITEAMCREMVAVSRRSDGTRSQPAPLANLLPRRHLFLFAALTPSAEGLIEKFFIKNPITGESLSITAQEPDKGSVLSKFISLQVEAHTEMLLPADDDTSNVTAEEAFAPAQVTIFARDAPFSFSRILSTDPTISQFLDDRSGIGEVRSSARERYVVTLADTVAIMSFYRHQSGQTSEASAEKKSLSGLTIPIFPSKALPRATKTKASNAEAFKKMLLNESAMRPEEWCHFYIDVFHHIGNATLQNEAAVVAAASKTKKKTKKSEAKKTDEELPVLLRQRRAFVGFYNSLPENERKRLALMCLLGRTCSTIYDAFGILCSHEDVVEVKIPGRLSSYVSNELEIEKIQRCFRSTMTRQLQVGEDTLKYFKQQHNDKTADIILSLRALEKMLGTYYENTDGGTGMVSLVHPQDSCIHHELIHNKTNTGRLASANPNCQNIPKEDKSPLREMFISRFGEKGMCIEADYSQLEVVCLAVLANDKQMLDDLRDNVDFHCKRVTMMRPDLNYDEVLQRAKKNKEPEFVKLRQQAKIFSFQRQYGAGVKMISKSTGLTTDQVRMLIEKEKETYRGVDLFNSMVTLSANNYDASLQDGSTRNVRGQQFFKGMFPVLTGSRYIFTESDVPEVMLRDLPATAKSTNFSPTHLKNYPVQGFAGEIVQIMLGVLWRHFVSTDNYGGLALLTNTVHDCVWVDCHDSIYLEVANDTEAIMSSVRTILNDLFAEIDVSVDFPCDVVAGENMGALRPVVREHTL